MDLSIMPALGVLLFGLAVVLLVGRRARRPEVVPTAAELYGPLPTADVEGLEPEELPGAGQVTPGAVTPAWAGSPQGYYQASGVGEGGPQHLSGPPPGPLAGAITAASRRESDEPRRPNLLPLVAAGGAAIGLGIFVYVRRRARRRSRIEQLKRRARGTWSVARGAAARTGSLATELPTHADRRTTAGGGAAVTAALLLYAGYRRWRAEWNRQAEGVRRAAESVPAKSGPRGSARGRALLQEVARWSGRSIANGGTGRGRAYAVGSAAIGALVPTAILVRRRLRPRLNWTGANVADSSPARGMHG